MENLIEALIHEPAKDFAKHLLEPTNEKIIFSGKFGKGKTTFLLHFFGNQTKYLGSDSFDVYFIDPVNYTVATNEDIFKYIKYDILLALLEYGKKTDSIEFSDLDIVKHYIAENPGEVIKALLKYVPKVGKHLEDLVKVLDPLVNKIREFGKQRREATESNRAISFLDSIEEQEYSIYENDIITKLIRDLLKKPAQKEAGKPDISEKQNILVIDNLDRIDPEHIFRILNIFSAHIDYRIDRIQANKFGFDKVVLVCDISNIRNIFYNKYGSGVDFSGYIDKFYSVDIFYFQNYIQIARTVHTQLRNLQIGFSIKETNNFGAVALDHGIFNIATALVNANKLGLREIFNFCKTPFIIEKNAIPLDDEMEARGNLPLWNTPIMEMKMLSKMIGGAQELLKSMTLLQHEEYYISGFNWHTKLLILFDLRYTHKFRSHQQMGYHLQSKTILVSINMDQTKPRNIELNPTGGPVGSQLTIYEPTIQDFYYVYLKVLRDLHKMKYVE